MVREACSHAAYRRLKCKKVCATLIREGPNGNCNVSRCPASHVGAWPGVAPRPLTP